MSYSKFPTCGTSVASVESSPTSLIGDCFTLLGLTFFELEIEPTELADIGSPHELQNFGFSEEYSILVPQLVQNIDLMAYNKNIL
jgi:hypothetical protein